MRTVLCCLMLLPPGSVAAPDLTHQIAADIKALSDVPRLPAQPEVFDPRILSPADHRRFQSLVTAQAPELIAAMDRLAQHLRDEYAEPLLSWNVTFTFCSALAGRPVSDRVADRLATAVVTVLDSALNAREYHRSLQTSQRFVDAVSEVFRSLRDLGLSRTAAALLTRQLIATADDIIERPFFRPTSAHDTLADKLTGDFAALAAARPLAEPVDTRHMSFAEYLRLQQTVRTEAPALQAVMDGISHDIRDEYGANIIQWSFAFTLANSLAGRSVPPAKAHRLAVTFIGAFDNALLCATRHTELHACLEFRDPVNNVPHPARSRPHPFGCRVRRPLPGGRGESTGPQTRVPPTLLIPAPGI